MFRVVESHRVTFSIDGEHHATFLRELLAVPIDHGELALVRLRTARAEATRGAVLLVHGFGMNRHTWHLGQRSFAGYLADENYDVFVLELRGVGRSRELGSQVARHPEAYVLGDLPAAVRATCMRSGHATTFALGHSMGGLVIYCAMDALQRQLAGVVTLSAVYTFAGRSRVLRLLTTLGRRLAIPRRLQDTPFAVRAIGKKLGDYIGLADSQLFRRLMPFQAWYPEAIERELLLKQIRIGWDISSLGVLSAILHTAQQGEVVTRDGRNLLDTMPDVDLPLLVIAAEDDTLLPPVDARAAYEHSRSSDKEFVVFGPDHGHERFGHLDLIIGKHAPRQIWPVISGWLHAHTDPVVPQDRPHTEQRS